MPIAIKNVCLPKTVFYACMALMPMLVSTAAFSASPAKQRTFDSPDAAVAAAVKAVKINDQVALHAMLGPDSNGIISSGDAIDDARSRKIFLHVYGIAHQVIYQDASHATLVIGRGKRPAPIPLVKVGDRWQFDTARGEAQIISKRIARNEWHAMQACLAIVYAERQYAGDHPRVNGAPVYTTKMHSSPGRYDGLYWPAKSAESASLLGVMLSDATAEGYPAPGVSYAKPYRGYFYRITVDKRDTGTDGFTVLAFPANYGVSGVRTFFVHADGMVYGKNLGINTAAIVSGTPRFTIADGWQLSQPSD